MIISYMDHIAQRGQFDIETEEEVEVYLVEHTGFTEDKGLASWQIVDGMDVDRNMLHYNDTADGGNKNNGSWREFYLAECRFGENPLYNGSEKFFKDGFPAFGGVAKAAIYLRYSQGFLFWMEQFDPIAAEKIQGQIPDFEQLIENPKTKKLPAKWHTFKAPKASKRNWALPVVCTLSNGSRIVLGLKNNEEADWDDLDDLEINITRSLELMSFLETPSVQGKGIISEVLQMGSGLGRNAFGKTYKGGEFNAMPDAEYTRLMGYLPQTSREKLLEIWGNKLSYRIKVAPNPDSSELLFMPEGKLKYSKLKEFVDKENQKKTAFFEAREKKKRENNEDTEQPIINSLKTIPVHAKAALFLTNIEGEQKKKLIIQQIFPSISLEYVSRLNSELYRANTQYNVILYMKKALTCQDKDTPSAYRYWTTVFTASLQQNYISAYEVYHYFQRFCKAYSGENLIDKGKARDYFRVIGKLRRLQHLIHTARTSPDQFDTSEFPEELNLVEQNKITKKGVFLMDKQNPPDSIHLVGDVYHLLRDKQKEKLDAFVNQAWQGVPSDDFSTFVRGTLTGMLLNELTWIITQEKRKFSVTQGRHPSTLRGEQIVSVFAKGIGLLINMEKQHLFNGNTLPFVKSCTEESKKDSFNSGLIMGLVFRYKQND